MAETKRFGPYKGSKQNGGRPIYVYKKKVNSKWETTSSNKARVDYEDAHHETLACTSSDGSITKTYVLTLTKV
jgi:hypothetical protein